jgi:predicted Zn-dependent peptidase
LNSDLDRYRAVTAADVQRIARKYLTVENRTTIEYLPL